MIYIFMQASFVFLNALYYLVFPPIPPVSPFSLAFSHSEVLASAEIPEGSLLIGAVTSPLSPPQAHLPTIVLFFY